MTQFPFFLRFFLWRCKPKTSILFCALLQDFFVFAEIFLLCPNRSIRCFLFFVQWSGIVFAHLLGMRLTLSHFTILRHPRSLLDSAKALKVGQWVALGVVWMFFSEYLADHTNWSLPSAWIQWSPLWLLGLGILAALAARTLDPETELKASNPLFYLQWKWFFNPNRKAKESSTKQSFPHEIYHLLDPRYPVYRKTSQFIGRKIANISIQKGESPHLIFLFLESFRAGNVGALGAKESVSPCFDTLADQGILYTQCSSTGVFTDQALLSTLFGIQPLPHMSFIKHYVNVSLFGLPDLIRQRGYKTALIQGGYSAFGGWDIFGASHGFDEMIGAANWEKETHRYSWGVHDEVLYMKSIEWLKKQKKSAFCALMTASNHHPWIDPTNKCPAPSNTKLQFLNTMSYADACLGHFIEELRKEGLSKHTILFIVGDHGQKIDEEQASTIRSRPCQQWIHVPLLIFGDGRVSRQRIDTPCSHLDLLPTVLDLMGIDGPHHSLGTSLLRDAPHPVFFSLTGTSARFGCRVGSWKWTALPDGSREELYDLSRDPGEEENLAFREKNQAETLKELALQHFGSVTTTHQQQSWAPPQISLQSICSFEAPITDQEIEDRLLTATLKWVDLQQCRKLTDRSLIALAKKSGVDLRYLMTPNSPFISDEGLFAIAEHCPNLTHFSAQGSPCITHRSIERILEQCAVLQTLFLGNLDCGMRSLRPKLSSTALYILSLSDIEIEGESLLQLLAISPHLSHLECNASRIQEGQWLPRPLSQLHSLILHGGERIAQEEMMRFINTHPNLEYISLSDCNRIQELSFVKHTQDLTLKNFPQLETLSIPGTFLSQLTLENCPRLRSFSLDSHQALKRVVVRNCPLIPREKLLDLRNLGIQVF